MVDVYCEDRMLAVFSRRACPARPPAARNIYHRGHGGTQRKVPKNKHFDNVPQLSSNRPLNRTSVYLRDLCGRFLLTKGLYSPRGAQTRSCTSLSQREGGHGRGVTLVELLVVISIIMILTVVILPTMQPAAESRRLREAARAVNVYLGAARNRAIETGRPCGVIFQRMTGEPRFSTILYKAEVPPAYAGDLVESTISITPTAGGWETVAFPQNDCWSGLVQAGAVLQLNYQGHRWTIEKIDDTDNSKWEFSSLTTSDPPFVPLPGVPFQIFRTPIKSAANPLQLPAGVVVDLSASGTDNTVMGTSGVNPIIMFSPNGSIGRCHGSGDPQVFTEPIFFLIGQRERPEVPSVTPPPEDELPNWIVPTNLWIALSPQTGLVVTTENYYVDPAGVGDWSNPGTSLDDARDYARQSQSMGGR